MLVASSGCLFLVITVASQAQVWAVQPARHPSLRAHRHARYQGAPPVWAKLTSSPAKARLPRTIWSYWEQGRHDLKGLNKICMNDWGSLNPGWEHRILEEADIYQIFPELRQIFKEHPRTVQQRSDMLRIWLLAQFGGIWADASLLPLKPLDSFVEQVVAPAGFFAFTFSDPGHVTSWFLAAMPRNSLVLQWKAEFVQRWRSGKKFAYMEFHNTLKEMVRRHDNSQVMAVWNRMPRITEDWPHSCISGCPLYWEVMAYQDIPPMLKRPYQRGNGNMKDGYPPRSFWKGHSHFRRVVEQFMRRRASRESGRNRSGPKPKKPPAKPKPPAKKPPAKPPAKAKSRESKTWGEIRRIVEGLRRN